jgi:hypothetical protein
MVDVSLAMQITGGLACLASLAPILTYLMFPGVRRLRYCELVVYVAINELICSLGIALGGVANGTVACRFQAFSTTAEPVAAGFWTAVIAYQLYYAVHYNGVIRNMLYFHLLCWLWPVIMTLLPLSTGPYANPDDEADW